MSNFTLWGTTLLSAGAVGGLLSSMFVGFSEMSDQEQLACENFRQSPEGLSISEDLKKTSLSSKIVEIKYEFDENRMNAMEHLVINTEQSYEANCFIFVAK